MALRQAVASVPPTRPTPVPATPPDRLLCCSYPRARPLVPTFPVTQAPTSRRWATAARRRRSCACPPSGKLKGGGRLSSTRGPLASRRPARWCSGQSFRPLEPNTQVRILPGLWDRGPAPQPLPSPASRQGWLTVSRCVESPQGDFFLALLVRQPWRGPRRARPDGRRWLGPRHRRRSSVPADTAGRQRAG